jgi:glutathione reductase (NADPH)
MAPTTGTSGGHYQLLVIGGGSGGVATARRAAKYGVKTLLIEGKALGGTCVNVGCVPKKVMWSASDLAARIQHARGYCFEGLPEKISFNWPAFKEKRDAYVHRLNGSYARNLEKEGVDYVFGWAKFADKKTVEVALREGGTKTYTADHILIAAGGKPKIPENVKGAEYGLTSDGFFDLETQPETVAIVGAGYIAVEFAGVFNGLGTKTHLLIRHDSVIRSFDNILGDTIVETYEKHGVHVHKQSKWTEDGIEKLPNGQLKLHFVDKDNSTPTSIVVDKVFWTVGREPLTSTLNVDIPGVKLDDKGKAVTDEYQNTNVPGIYSVGDLASNDVELTPVAIAAGRRLANRLFGPEKFKNDKLDYNNIPSAIFSHPESGSIGLSEKAARKKYGDDDIKVYTSSFISMYYAPLEQHEKMPTKYKIVCQGPDEKVVGLHLIGDGSSEILQGFGAAIKMGATKADFDNVVAIHPTSAEEIVTMV